MLRWRLSRLITILSVSLLLGSCGGGGGSSTSTPPPTRGLFYGYYLSQGTQPSEVYQSTNIAFLGGPVTSESELLDAAATYSNLGVRKFIVNLIGITPVQAGPILKRIQVFGSIVAVYPVDEPNVNGCDQTSLSAIRGLGYPMFTIYGPERFGWVCSQYFDILGLDNYDASGQEYFQELEHLSATAPGSQLILVPGGASPWKQDPKPYYDYAISHSKVIGILPFLWYSPPNTNLGGIRDNGMSSTYIELGKQIGRAN